MNPGLARLVGMAVGASFGMGVALAGDVAAALASVPPENLPTLALIAQLPDGRQFQSPWKKGCYVTYDAELVIASNHYDERHLTLRVRHQAGASDPLDVGMVSMPIRDIIERKPIPESQSLVGLGLLVERADGEVDGVVSGMAPVQNATNVAQLNPSRRHQPSDTSSRVSRPELEQATTSMTCARWSTGSPRYHPAGWAGSVPESRSLGELGYDRDSAGRLSVCRAGRNAHLAPVRCGCRWRERGASNHVRPAEVVQGQITRVTQRQSYVRLSLRARAMGP